MWMLLNEKFELNHDKNLRLEVVHVTNLFMLHPAISYHD